MKNSMWTSYYMDLSPEGAVEEIARHGWKYAELSDEHGAVLLERGDPQKAGRAFRKAAENAGVRVEQGHLWLQVPLCDPDRERIVSTLLRWLDLFHAVGIRASVLHCDAYSFPEGTTTEEKAEVNASVIRRLTEHLEGTDMTICLENLFVKPGVAPVVNTADMLLDVIARTDGKHLGICLDTGHLNVVGGNQLEFIRRAGDRLRALHIADNEGSWDMHMMPYGRGTVDFAAVRQGLREIGYDGLYNLEIPGERSCPMEIRGWKLEYLLKALTWQDERDGM